MNLKWLLKLSCLKNNKIYDDNDEDDKGEIYHFQIVGEDEADIALSTVSFASPLARALIGHKVGESVRWKRPAGDLNLEIIQITY